jgi:hypothetical protein
VKDEEQMFLRPVTNLLCMAMLAVAAQATTVFNGGFETGDLTGWTLTNGSVYDAVCQAGTPIGAATCIVNSGDYAMSLGHAGGVTALSQSLTTTPGAIYTLDFYLANDNPTDVGVDTFEVMWDGSSVYSLSSPQPSFPYTLVSLNVTATSNSTTLAFLAQQDPSQWFLDDVSVQAIPEATTMLMVAFGLVTAGLARRSLQQAHLKHLRSRSAGSRLGSARSRAPGNMAVFSRRKVEKAYS